jgi:DNA-binding NarL/FixJ family response regulator
MTDGIRIRLVSVDSHPLFREGIATIVNSQPDMSLVGTASKGGEAVQVFRVLRPDVTLMDLCLSDVSGLDVLMAIRLECPEARIIVLTAFERDVEVQRAFRAGARGFLLKSMPAQQVIDTIRQVHAGKKSVPPEIAAALVDHIGDEALSDREVQVLSRVAAGNRNRDIAEKLYIAEDTVKVHLKHIMAKLRANDRTAAVATAIRRGIIQI